MKVFEHTLNAMTDYRWFDIDIDGLKLKVHVSIDDLYTLGVIAPHMRFLDVFRITEDGLKRMDQQAITHIAEELASYCLAALYESTQVDRKNLH